MKTRSYVYVNIRLKCASDEICLQGIAEDTHIEFPTCKRAFYDSPAQFLARSNAGVCHSRTSELVLFGREPPRLRTTRQAGEDEIPCESDGE